MKDPSKSAWDPHGSLDKNYAMHAQRQDSKKPSMKEPLGGLTDILEVSSC